VYKLEFHGLAWLRSCDRIETRFRLRTGGKHGGGVDFFFSFCRTSANSLITQTKIVSLSEDFKRPSMSAAWAGSQQSHPQLQVGVLRMD
jgi:hypothetical protein